jgi:hypothetical protein
MGKKMSYAEWEEYIKKFESYNGSITVKDFCIENNICKTQFYYHKRRLMKSQSENIQPVFHAISLKESYLEENITSSNEVKITVGNVIITIPSSEATLIFPSCINIIVQRHI